MQIALTKKLADALGVKPPSADQTVDPLFTWTANWTNVWANRRTDDMLVLVNNATRLIVAIYQVKRKDLKKIEKMIPEAISNTLLALGLNPELVEEYLEISGKVEWAQNRSRKAAAWVTWAGSQSAFYVGRKHRDAKKVFDDTAGLRANYRQIDSLKSADQEFYPYKAMAQALAELTGKQIYKQHAFELLVTLDVDVYKVQRKIIVPSQLGFLRLHELLQRVFRWDDCHLYDFSVFPRGQSRPSLRLVPSPDDLEYDPEAELIEKQTLADFFPEQRKIIYTYDFGDNWEHEITLTRILEDYDRELPYLLEATGKTPPEDVGGIPGFLHFYEAISQPEHPEHEFYKSWAGHWTVELTEWESKPRVIHV